MHADLAAHLPAAVFEDDLGLGTRLQELADATAHELDRPVAIDDRQGRLLVHTEHRGVVDEVRLASILRQPMRPEVDDWVQSHDISTARHPVRVLPNDRLGMCARVCAPIRYSDHLLGYLWLTDRDQSITDAELERLGQIAAAAGVAMHRELLLRDRGRERELVRDMLSEDGSVREDAARRLVELGLVERDGPTVVLVASTPPAVESVSRVAFETAASRVHRRLTPKHALHLLRPDHVLLVVSCNEPSVRRHGVAALAARVRDEISDALERSREPVRVAIGGRVERLEGARTSYEQALSAAAVAGVVRERFGDVVSWDELGIYRMLAGLPLAETGQRMLHPGLRALLERPQTHFLVHTLECYLDHGGDVRATAAALYVHRATLYHRLRRVEEVGGIDLRDGEQRLELHFGLKLARLQGLRWSDEAP